MQNLRKQLNNNFTRILLPSLLIVFIGVLLTGCNLGVPSTPTVVSTSSTLPPFNPTETSAELPADSPSPADTESTVDPTEPQPTVTTIPQAEVFPNPENYTFSVFAEGLQAPVFLTHAGDGSGRIFVIEKVGRILIFEDGTRRDAAFLNIAGEVNSQDSERGLLGLAFHPNYPETPYFYVNYTDLSGTTVVSRFQVSADDPNLADPNSEKVLLKISQPFANHNGGMIAFGPDGYLYIGMGDGGSGGDPQGNAQNPQSLLGKMLRIDVDNGDPYATPADNAPNALPEIWALGVRNPWRFSFDRATGDLLIGDVGQNAWEEIDFLPAGISSGLNLGWNYYEGTHEFQGQPSAELQFVSPIFEYSHSGGQCSVTGGYVYRGQALDAWQGVYLFGDYCAGVVWGALQGADGSWQIQEMFSVGQPIASFGEDEDGEVYLVSLSGTILKLVSQ